MFWILSICLSFALCCGSVAAVEAKTIQVIATAYCSCQKCCGKNAVGITKSGKPVQEGMIAVDPQYIKLGTRVKINGKVYVAEDTGSAIKGGRRIDIYMLTHQSALLWGRQKVEIEF